jgi:hypothetical protein
MDIVKMLASGASPDEIAETFFDNLAAATIQKQKEKEERLCVLSTEIYEFLRMYYPTEFKKASEELRRMISPVELNGFFLFLLEQCVEGTLDLAATSSLATSSFIHPLNLEVNDNSPYKIKEGSLTK